MPSMQVIKRRISSVRSTQQITKAMNLVSASKLQKAKQRLLAARPFFSETKNVLDRFKNTEDAQDNIFIKPREVKNAAYIVITSDMGLCGGYNYNVSKEALAYIEAGKKEGVNETIIAVGAKGWDFFKRRKKNILCKYAAVSDAVYFEDASNIGDLIKSLYTSGEADEVYIAYTRFESVLSHVPHVEKILPIAPDPEQGSSRVFSEFDPDADAVLEYLIPRHLKVLIYGAMMESVVCEKAASMVSMDAATNNATEIIDDLTLVYNRIRQGAITQELNEIVSGANALK